MIAIIQKGDNVLRAVSKNVAPCEILSPKIQKVVKDLQQALDENLDGLAIAGPQIGVPLRIFVISKRIFSLDDFGHPLSKHIKNTEKIHKDIIFINPEIINQSKKTQVLLEGCLSVRSLYGNVERSEKATVKAYDIEGSVFTRGASKLMAQIFQHEIDHLEGILFCDKATDLQRMDISPRAVKKLGGCSLGG
ncbi:peptide deformylase [Patescibacteria group bacterium]|nr:peptide deformylase [Patescibacteria group bacterium]MBU1730360.1 peptide deformylase [Patescibacteria group bacterium]MBU1956155.1 peptide deformylase [Patescibacteria group bacterium]MBU2009914.1 peptide deformylase [Patescibacteria group bacterium]MBU2416952.1 peptide deformylase [Patescibacteria group bacterium]